MGTFIDTIKSTNLLVSFLENSLVDTIFTYESKVTPYTKKGFIRFISSYDGSILYVSKRKIIIITHEFNFSCSNEFFDYYKTNNKEDFIKKLQQVYSTYRFFGEHYPDQNKKYSIY